MGSSKLITLVIRKSSNKEFISEWQTKYEGKATTEKLSVWRDKFNASLSKGGANEHLGIRWWLQCGLEVYNQKTMQIICTYKSPMFELIP